ncbi:hypothetical protein JCM10908_005092 [Rhodotorula pacifica]|uniref:uncharacterized protein n=1 Tax=Rhodotorula pacifica TaxID=1495444 RepID=UPI00317D74A8
MLAEPLSRESPFVALTSLALAPPHRPAQLHTGLYPSLLSSHDWVKRFTILQELGDPDVAPNVNGRGGRPRGHTVISEAYGSTGCVNALAWESGGPEARLASGGDDTKICIWAPGVEGTLLDYGGESQSPVLGYGLTETIDTGHRANIFDIAWAPNTPNGLFSVAGDHTVRVYDISLATSSKLSTTTITPPAPHRPFQHHEDATACTEVYRCHTDRVKRIATEASPHVFMTCGEDGTVRQHDTRVHHTCRTSRFQASGEADCPPPLASYPSLSLYSLSLSLLRPHLFVVAGTSQYAYLHDRRMIRQASADWSLPTSLARSDDLTVCVRRFGVPDPHEPWKGDIANHIVSARLSPDRPRDLLVSYSEDALYLFDTDSETFVRPGKPQQPTEGEMWRGGSRFGGGDDDGPGERDGAKAQGDRSEDEVASLEMEDIESGHEASGSTTDANQAGTRATSTEEDDEAQEADEDDEANEMDEDEEEDAEGDEAEDDDDDDDEPPFDPYAKPAKLAPQSEVPMVAPLRKYEGHANSQVSRPNLLPQSFSRLTSTLSLQTVKDCNFIFADTVVSGSDDGNWFAWDRANAEVVGIFHGDNSVVNVMTPHPKLPIVAVSGIDEVVKLFGPTSDPELIERSNLAEEYETIKQRNARTQRQGRYGSSLGAERLLQMLLGRVGVPVGDIDDDDEENAEAGGVESGGDEGEDGGGRTGGRQGRRPPRRRVRIVTTGEDGDEVAQDCLLM